MNARAAIETRRVHGRLARIALLGCGNVGSEVAAHLLSGGGDTELVGALVRDAARDRNLPAGLLTTDPDEIFERRPDLIVEVLGGTEPAYRLVHRALQRGISVVTANKTLIAHHGRDLLRIARDAGATLSFEASVCAGVPVLGALQRLRGDRVLSIQGVVNGTCNAILSYIESGLSPAAALAQAQQLGLAEADPTADITGRDSAEKLCILAAAAGIHPLGRIHPADIACEGIAGITIDDLDEARRGRRTVRLIAEADARTGTLRVGPALLPCAHPLASLRGAVNGLLVRMQLAGELFFRGAGAGPQPTASAILSDVARLIRRRLRPRRTRPAARPRNDPQHYVRIAGQPAKAEPVLERLAEHRAAASEVAFSHGRISALVSLDESAARACARDLAAPAGKALVMPLLA